MKRWARWALGGTLLLVQHAHAQGTLASELKEPAARAAYEAAVGLFRHRDHEKAVVKFEEAYKAFAHPELLWNIAACQNELHRYARTLDTLERYQRATAGQLSPEKQKALEEHLARVTPLVSTVELVVVPAGASVSVDGEEVGTTPLAGPLRLDLGVRKIRVRKAGFEEQVITRQLTGSSDRAEVRLVPRPQVGRLMVEAGGQGTISVDGKVVGEGRWDGPLPAGSHTVRVTAPGMQPHAASVPLAEGETRELRLTLVPEKPRGLSTLFWVAGGTVLAIGLGTGAYFLFRPADRAQAEIGTWSPGTVQLP